MKNICVLDVTLRDGGCVNNFNFGEKYMCEILSSLEASGVEYIELGYIDENKGSETGRTQFISEKVISEYFLTHKSKKCSYVAMMDYGKFDARNFGARTPRSIDGIRVAFHKKDWKDAINTCKEVLNKGYELFVQPMLIMRYTDSEILELVSAINRELPNAKGVYIVDSFGEMRPSDVIRKMHLLDNNLSPDMIIGFHSHNNLQLSYSNAMALLDYKTSRSLMLDSSVMGMGKGAGNLNTELLLEHLNIYNNKNYKIAPLLELIDKVINVIHKEFYWGYSAEYYLSSINACTPSYASHFYNRHMLTIEQVAELLSLIPDNKKISFDAAFAETLYLEYNAKNLYDDTAVINELKDSFSGCKVLLIAPGKSIADYSERITALIKQDDIVSISLNNFAFDTDFVLVTRPELLPLAIKNNRHVIAPSNIETITGIKTINYRKWIITGEKTFDSAGAISIKLMTELKPSYVLLAGFDGFSVDINKNYFDKAMRRPVNEAQAETRNSFYKALIEEFSEKVDVEFVTPSLYERK